MGSCVIVRRSSHVHSLLALQQLMMKCFHVAVLGAAEVSFSFFPVCSTWKEGCHSFLRPSGVTSGVLGAGLSHPACLFHVSPSEQLG